MTNYQSLEDETTAVELTSPSSDAEAQDAASDRALLGDHSGRANHSAPLGTITRENRDESGSSPGFDLRKAFWHKRAQQVLAGLVGLAFVLVIAAYLFDLDDVLEGRKVTFFVVGDWGRNGQYNQSLVAAAMAQHARKHKPQFIISTGDNFYESGLTSTEDEQFRTSFTDVYNDPGLQVEWWAVLGNHDYGEMWNVSVMPAPTNCRGLKYPSQCYYSPLHELSAALTRRDWRWHCERWYQRSLGRGDTDFFFIDTNPGVSDYRQDVWAANKGGLLEQSWEAELLELDSRLAASRAKWKLVVGHHPILSNNFPIDNELSSSLQPILERHGVQAYFSGHEHMLAHLRQPGFCTHQIISGGGSLTDYPPHFDDPLAASLLQYPGSGFVSCSLDVKEDLKCKFIGIHSEKAVYSLKIPLDLCKNL
ncbi:hypothetical protein WJX73_001645 [Symbiochloris irregularis]|uniref:Calcineurin-like phosphoesterase domain-containing protein n=1 Tax=Symbiochloris irregularis TaxID=706552 RepID=A0AAW1PYL1_9CHLO